MTKVIIVENEVIVAKDIDLRLKNLGYSVISICHTGKDAIEKVETLKPDLILMDISLKDNISGIEAAKKIQENNDIPIIFITAYGDKKSLDDMKMESIFGYILKPFDNKELQINIELALYKHKSESKLRKMEAFYKNILQNISEGLVVTDNNLKVIFTNSAAKDILGIEQEDLLHKNFLEIIDPEDEYSLRFVMDCLLDTSRNSFSTDELIFSKDNKDIILNLTISPIKETDVSSLVFTFRDETEKRYSKDVIGFIVESTSLLIGEEFFNNLVKQLAEVLNVKFAFICEYLSTELNIVRTIYSWEINNYGNRREFSLIKTPAEKVILGESVFYSNKVHSLFPHDEMLREHEIESYLAVPIFNAKNEIIGFMGVMDSKGVKKAKNYETILKFISGRVSLELQRKKDQDDLLQSEARNKYFIKKYENLTNSLPQTIFEIDSVGKVLFANDYALNLFGYEERDFFSGINIFEIISSENPANVKYNMSRIMNGENLGFNEYLVKRKDGTIFPVIINASRVVNESNETIGIRGIAIDISELRQTQRELEESKERYDLTIKGSNDGVWDWNIKTNEIYFSPKWKSMLGYTDDELENSYTQWFSKIHNHDIDILNEKINLYVNNKIEHFEIEYRMLNKQNNYLWVLCKGTALRDKKGKAYRIAGSHTDISQHKDNEELLNNLLHNASHDLLTGLPNRSLFLEKLERCIVNSKRKKDILFSVLYIDIDRFKVVNDTLGHSMGNLLLIEVSKRIQTCLSPDDVIARLSGDEFGILIEEITDVNEAVKIAKKIQKEVKKPFNLHEHEVFTSSSIGITFSSSGYEKAEEVLRDADMAMFRAKALGRSRYEVFDSNLHLYALELLQLETDLRYAIDRNEFLIHYQPIVSFKTGKITGFEALIRWEHKSRGLISSGVFIPIAEENGMIIPIGSWVLREASKQIKEWNEKFTFEKPLTMSVNISGKQFSFPNIIESITETLEEVQVDPKQIKFEITESTIMENAENARTMLQQIRDLNIQLQIDDFGTGYSSLSYLHRFPVNTLKVDRSFVSRIGSNDENVEIVKTIISLAKNLNMESIAEGIETEEQLYKLKDMDCSYGQGYFFSKPVPVNEIEELLKRNPTW